MMILKNVEEFTKNWKNAIKEKIAQRDRELVLGIVQVGHNTPVEAEVGIRAINYSYDKNIDLETFLYELKLIQEKVDGIIILSPLPEHLQKEELIDPEKDVGKFCVPSGIMKYLEYCGWEPEGEHVVIIGQSLAPLARMMTEVNATVTLCHSKTKHLRRHIDAADLIICAIGQSKFLNCYAIHVPVIDVNGNECYNTEDTLVATISEEVIRCMILENMLK